VSERFVCIHGHFYQPPRENPWLGRVEREPSARPFHDWNERVTTECYRPNGAARILDRAGRLLALANNYEAMSFDFGPTLLSWLEREAPDVYQAVLDADRASRARCGHGSAMAQAYGHPVLPLAPRRDKETQVRWALADFEHRFGRPAAGLWLPETAVDGETLEVLAAAGVAFTVLDPRQARRVRPLRPGVPWQDASGGTLDPRRPYLCRLPSGAAIAVFFYSGALSRAIAFEGLLHDGEGLARALLGAFDGHRGGPQLVHVATDGETYGHHHRHGEMALAFALRRLGGSDRVQLINYAAFLERYPPEAEVEVVPASSWSCPHGVERWRAHCGCSTGGREGWTQEWRRPLREALDALREDLDRVFEEHGGELFRDPWATRDDAVRLTFDRSAAATEAFLARHRRRPLDPAERARALELLEMARCGLLMFASCGWFFADLAGLETRLVLTFAARALELAREIAGRSVAGPFLERLAAARSNQPARGDGRDLWQQTVQSARRDPNQLAVAATAARLFGVAVPEPPLWSLEVNAAWALEHDGRRLRGERLRVRSRVSGREREVQVVLLHGGHHHLAGGARTLAPGQAPRRFLARLRGAFADGDLVTVVRLLDRLLRAPAASLAGLPPDTAETIQEELLARVEDAVREELAARFRAALPLLDYAAERGRPLPPMLAEGGRIARESDLRAALAGPEPDLGTVWRWRGAGPRWGLPNGDGELAELLREALGDAAAELLAGAPVPAAHRALALLELARELTLPVAAPALEDACFQARRRVEEGTEAAAVLAALAKAL
jgi:alpha-amylase/alpha-mannosidase (GH57 family)